MSAPQSQPPSALNLSTAPQSSSLWTDVVCGSDFSESSAQAGQVAAVLSERLMLVHVIDEVLQKNIPDGIREPLRRAACDRLQDEQEGLRAAHRASIRTVVRIGTPAAMLRKEAETHQAKLIVVGAARREASHPWSEMSIVEDVAETAKVPTLIVHEAASFLQWIRGDRRLRIFVGADLSAPSESALDWADWLRNKAPCEIFATFLGREPAHLDSNTVPSLFLDEMVLKAAHSSERLFEEKVRARLGLSHVHMRFGKKSGHSAETLVRLAVEERADLMIVGTHSRQGWHRIGHRSVSRFVLRHAPLNILVCPAQTHLK